MNLERATSILRKLRENEPVHEIDRTQAIDFVLKRLALYHYDRDRDYDQEIYEDQSWRRRDD